MSKGKEKRKEKNWFILLFICIFIFLFGIYIGSIIEKESYADNVTSYSYDTTCVVRLEEKKLYFHGDCETAREIIDLDKREDNIENLENEITDKIWSNFEYECTKYIQNNIRKLSD